jgi:uncharacterized glyoxalase superfamily protein PhnB
MKNANASEFGASAIPVMRYRNLPAAIDWLCSALGFSRHHIVTGGNGAILFAQLTLGRAMIMVGPVRQSAFDKFLKQPDEIGGAETQVCYFFVADAHAHCARAKAAGAEIVFDIEGKASGGRSYSCRDPEGHLWNFGTYDPWRRNVVQDRRRGRSQDAGWRRSALAIGLSTAVLAAIAALVWAPGLPHKLVTMRTTDNAPGMDPQNVRDELVRERAARVAAERAEQEIRGQLTEARGAKATAEATAQHARRLLVAMQNVRRTAERVAKEALRRLAEVQSAKDAAEHVARDAQERLARMQIRKGAAERAASEAKRQLAMERNANAKRAANNFQLSSEPAN